MRIFKASDTSRALSPESAPTNSTASLSTPAKRNWSDAAMARPLSTTVNGLPESWKTPQVNSQSLFKQASVWLREKAESVFPALKKPVPSSPWQELVEQYAESPFERDLLMAKKDDPSAKLTQSWAKGFASADEMTRDAAVSLFRTFVNYGRLDSTEKLSPHTQLKMLHFMAHLDEGKPALAQLYRALIESSSKTAQPFLEALGRDFQHFNVNDQLATLRSLTLATPAADPDKTTWKTAMRAMVTTFYTQQGAHQEVILQQLLAKQEKIRLGFLRFQPIEEAYQQAIEETDKRYRTRLRQLKRQRQLLLSQADEERQRRIGQIYDDLESPLLSTLSQADFDLNELTETPEAVTA